MLLSGDNRGDKMKTSIEKREVDKQGRQSLRLIHYFGTSVDPETGKRTRHRSREPLDLFVFQNPKTAQQRQHNKETLKLAESIKAKRTVEAQLGKYDLNNDSKVAANFYDYYQKICDTKKGSRSNHSVWVSVLSHVKTYHGSPLLSFKDITPKFLEGFREYLQTQPLTKSGTKLSSNTASTYFNKLRAALNQAFKEGIVRDNPVVQVKSIKPTQTKREHLTLDEVKSMVKAECRYEVLKRSFLFSCITGLRWSDIQKLTWEEVEKFDSGYRIVFNQKKTGGLQYLDLSERAYQLMGQPVDSNPRVFAGLRYSAWHNTALLQWAMRAGISKHITFHSGRHTFAVLQLTNGTDIYTVSKLLGHSELKTTQVYADIIEQKRKEAMNVIPDIFEL